MASLEEGGDSGQRISFSLHYQIQFVSCVLCACASVRARVCVHECACMRACTRGTGCFLQLHCPEGVSDRIYAAVLQLTTDAQYHTCPGNSS